MTEDRFVSLDCSKHFHPKLQQKQVLKEVGSTVVLYQRETFHIMLTFFLLLLSVSCLLLNCVGPRVKQHSLKAEQKAFFWSVVLYCTLIQAFEAKYN